MDFSSLCTCADGASDTRPYGYNRYSFYLIIVVLNSYLLHLALVLTYLAYT